MFYIRWLLRPVRIYGNENKDEDEDEVILAGYPVPEASSF
jgi:hypothetical protein